MRIVSWNVNGLRSLSKHYSGLNTCQDVLALLEADIICLQEIRCTRPTLVESQSIVLPGYDPFFSFTHAKKGHSGVAVYTSTETAIPLKAQEGLTGCLQLDPPLTYDEQIIPGFHSLTIEDVVLQQDRHPEEQKAKLGDYSVDVTSLDMEGRALMLDFGLFVLLNVYCPYAETDKRLPFKMAFHRLLQKRVCQLRGLGREVIIVGDINICAAPIDHGEGTLESVSGTLGNQPTTRWMTSWLSKGKNGMVDVLRMFHKDRKGMYTYWDPKLRARNTNFGYRFDYVIVTPGLLPWFKFGDIQPSVKGSSHCPIYVDLHDEITLEDGQKKFLKDEMRMTENDVRELPRLAATNWDEYSGKDTLDPFLEERVNQSQSTLSQRSDVSMDVDRDVDGESTPPSSPPPSQSQPYASPHYRSPKRKRTNAVASTSTLSATGIDIGTSSSTTIRADSPSSSQTRKGKSRRTSPSLASASASHPTASPARQVLEREETEGPKADVRQDIRGLRSKRAHTSAPRSQQPIFIDIDEELAIQPSPPPSLSQPPAVPLSRPSKRKRSNAVASSSTSNVTGVIGTSSATVVRADSPSSSQTRKGKRRKTSTTSASASQPTAPPAMQRQASEGDEPSPEDPGLEEGEARQNESGELSKRARTSAQWTRLMAPPDPPRCHVHNEPAMRMVTGRGKDKGRVFWLCSRPVGPGYDRGKKGPPKHEVDDRWRCNFHKFDSEVKRAERVKS